MPYLKLQSSLTLLLPGPCVTTEMTIRDKYKDRDGAEKDERGRDRWEEPEAGTEVQLKVRDNEMDSHSQRQRERQRDRRRGVESEQRRSEEGIRDLGQSARQGLPPQDKCGLTLYLYDLL